MHPLFPELVSCPECGTPITSRRRWCGPRCKLRAWTRLHPDRKYTRACVCVICQRAFQGAKGQKYCSDPCQAKAKKPKQIVTRACVECAQPFTVHVKTSQQQTCSPKCRAARLSKILRGKKQRPTRQLQCVCAECSKQFTTSKQTKVLCDKCRDRKHGPRDHGKPEKRAKLKGVPYVYGIKPASVFERDHWRCQLCGCKTPQRLRGKNQPTSPEVDHITPLSRGGGHTWNNVQCACRKCNIEKRATVRGQLRLAI